MTGRTRKQAAQATGVPERRILFYSDQLMFPGVYLPVGRGHSREYKIHDLFYLMVIRDLSKLGLSLSNIRPALQHLDLVKNILWIDEKTIRKPAYLVLVISEETGDAERWEVVIGEKDIGAIAKRSAQVILNLNAVFGKLKL